jgi:hypothetical protein
MPSMVNPEIVNAATSDELKETVALIQQTLKDRGESTRKSPVKKTSHERAEMDFDPSCCHARDFAFQCHPGTEKRMWNVPDKEKLLCGLIPMQCNKPIKDKENNLCSLHSNTERFKDNGYCAKTGKLALGLYSKPLPEEPIRVTAKSNSKKKYVWVQNTDEKYDEYKTTPDGKKVNTSPSKPKTTKKAEKKKTEKKEKVSKTYSDFSWNDLISSDDIWSQNKSTMILYLDHHNLDKKGSTQELGKRIKKHILTPNDPIPEVVNSMIDNVEEAEAAEEAAASEEAAAAEEAAADAKAKTEAKAKAKAKAEAEAEAEDEAKAKAEEEAEAKAEEEAEAAKAPKAPESDSDSDTENEDENEDEDDNVLRESKNDEDEALKEEEQTKITVNHVEYEVEDGIVYNISEECETMGKIDYTKPNNVDFLPGMLDLHKANVFR